MPIECPNCETKSALYATEYVEDSSNPFHVKRLKKVTHCPFCGAEFADA